jgi:KipI family sensor histidine kinase inhibitor
VSGVWPQVQAAGDCGVLVEFAPEVSPEMTARVLGADAALAALPGVIETVPAFRSVLVVYDPLRVRIDELMDRAEACARTAGPATIGDGRLIEIPVAYGGSDGPDLDAVADACGLTPAQVVRLHSGATYIVFMLGFSPGYPYLGPLPEAIRVPRRASPRLRIPAGSVAVADRFSGIYPRETAGGWHVLGRTPLRLFDLGRDPVFLLHPGDRVRFVGIEARSSAEASPVRPDRPAAAGLGLGPPPRRPVFEVLEPGLLSTVQDFGRSGWRRYGVPPSGALDRAALAAANLAVGNEPDAAGLECAFPGPRLRVLDDVEIAIAGADLEARHNKAAVVPGEALRTRPGDVIDFAAPGAGQWAYLAVTGGLDVPVVFGSRATHSRGALGGIRGRPLRAGDVLGRGEGGPGSGGSRPPAPAAPHAGSRDAGAIRVVLGPQAAALTTEAQAAWLSRPYQVTPQGDRSGVRLRGPTLRHRGRAEILSDGLLPGAVQVPAEGQPIVILADGPTTGGYPKIATVITADLGRLAQAVPGTRLRFMAVSVAEAHEAWAAATAAPGAVL